MSFTRQDSFPNEHAPTRNRKRLIVLCDGTWQDSTSDSDAAYPSNVTRFQRALSERAYVPSPDGTGTGTSTESIDQIVFYQKGVGTGLLDRYIGGASGLGVSANVRAAYSFLSHNYDVGDQIYFFGFSRGAYTARLLAGLVAAHGLLTKKGMDSFSVLFRLYWKDQGKNRVDEETREAFVQRLTERRLIQPEAAKAIEIVGVWDTVAFHKTGLSKTVLAKMLGIRKEYARFKDTQLSPNVKYGFHALALDERRRAYEPTLWSLPTAVIRPGENASEPARLKELSQVWFSGNHTDIGGGKLDHRLSDIALAWMIAQCSKDHLLAFDGSCVFEDEEKRSLSPPLDGHWGTREGATVNDDDGILWKMVGCLHRVVPFVDKDRTIGSHGSSKEKIHCSIEDRRFGSYAGARNADPYQCRLLTGKHRCGGWQLASNPHIFLQETAPDEVEELLRGHIRPAGNHLGHGSRF